MKRSKRRMIIILAAALVAVLSAVCLSACDPDEPENAGAFTETVSSAEDMEKIRSSLGAYYDQGVFELTSDIVLDGDWTPIGTSVTDSFRGTLDGKGHTITFAAELETPSERVTDPAATASRGLFGYLNGATVKNLNINVSLSVPVNANMVYAGALAGFAYGDVTVENVGVTGSVEVNMTNVLETGDYNSFGMSASVGGVIGYAIGDIDMNNVVTDASVAAEVFSAPGGMTSAIRTLQIGGVAGTIRTADISSESHAPYASVSGVACSGSVTAYAYTANAGGLFGLSHRTVAADVSYTGALDARFVSRLNVGGIAGTQDAGEFSDMIVGTETADASVTVAKASNIGTATAGIGGVTGYLSNGSVINNAVSFCDITIAETSVNAMRSYVGGIAGQIYFSDVANAASSGSFRNDSLFVLTDGGFSHAAAAGFQRDYYANCGGIAGRLYGDSTLANVTSLIDGVYHGIAGEALGGYEVVSLEADETIADWLYDNGYPADTVTEEISGDDDEDNTYLIRHRYTVTDAVYAGCEAENAIEGTDDDTEGVNNVGTKGDEAALRGRLAAILSAINE